MKTLLVIALLAACARTPKAVAPAPFCPSVDLFAEPARFVGRAYYELLGADVEADANICDSAELKPALGCSGLHIVAFDGCYWRCVRIVDLPRRERQ